MRRYTVKVDTDTIDDISCAGYLESSHSDIIRSILTNPNFNINDEMFQKYCEKYTEAYMNYGEYKSQLQQKYIGNLVYAVHEWNLDFSSGLLTITVPIEDNETDQLLKKKGFERVE